MKKSAIKKTDVKKTAVKKAVVKKAVVKKTVVKSYYHKVSKAQLKKIIPISSVAFVPHQRRERFREILKPLPECGWKTKMLKLLDQKSDFMSEKKYEAIKEILVVMDFLNFKKKKK